MFGKSIKFKTYKIHRQITKDMLSDSMVGFFLIFKMEICFKNKYIEARC